MESAIPPFLRVARTRPIRVSDDFVPPYPSFVARIGESVRQVVMAYFGAQAGSTTGIDVGPDGPRHRDVARQEDADDLVIAAYWEDVAAFDRWFARCREPWLAGPGGRWIEVIRPRVERFETIFGRRSRPEGVAVLAEEFSGAVRRTAPTGAACATACPRRRPIRSTSLPGSMSSAMATACGCGRAAASA